MNEKVNKELLLDHPSHCVQEILNRGFTSADLWEISYRLQTIAFWHANSAICSEITKNSNKNENWANYVEYLTYSNKYAITSIENTGEGSLMWIQLCGNYILNLGFGRFKEAAWLGKKFFSNTKEINSSHHMYVLKEIEEFDLNHTVEKSDDPRNINVSGIDFDKKNHLFKFCMRMWLILTCKEERTPSVADQMPQCGVYEKLFINWDNQEFLNSNLHDIADFHIQRSQADKAIHHDIPEFESTPFRQIPFEILAYRNVRRKMGLETPWPSHPLLDSPFVKNLPDELPPSDDPLLNEVLAAVRKVLPDV